VKKKGRSKYIELNDLWIRKNFPSAKSIYDEVPTLVKYRSFKQLLEKKQSFIEVAKGNANITLNEMLSPLTLTSKIEHLEKENAKLKEELRKLKEKV
jgi:hypothetical protein